MAANTGPAHIRRLRARVATARRWGTPDADALRAELRTEVLVQQVIEARERINADQRRRVAALLLDAEVGEQA